MDRTSNFKKLRDSVTRVEDSKLSEEFDEQLERPMGRERLIDGDFSGLSWPTFEKLIAQLLVASEEGHEVCVLQLPGQGNEQGGCDILSFHFDMNHTVKAYEAKRNSKKFTKGELLKTTTRFASKYWFSLASEFNIFVSGEVDEKADQEYQKLKVEWNEQHGIKLFIRDKAYIWNLLCENVHIATRILPLADCERIFQEATLRATLRAAAEESARIQRETSFQDVTNEVTTSLATNISAPKIVSNSNHYSWRNNVVRLSASLPTEQVLFGSCQIGIHLPESQGVTFSFQQNEILTRLWSGTGLTLDSKKRGFITTLGSSHPTASVFFGGAGCIVPRSVGQSLCDAIDGMLPHYLSALRKIEQKWGVKQMKFEWDAKREHLRIVLCRIPARLWEHILAFVKAHDFEQGDSDWHIFDATGEMLKVYNRDTRAGLAPGYHTLLHATAHINPFSWRDPGGEVDLIWGLPSRYITGPIDDAHYWSASKTLEWLENDLLPTLKKWLWNQRTLRERSKLKMRGISAIDEFPDRLVTDYRTWNHIDLPKVPCKASLEDLTSSLQSTYSSASIEKHVEVPNQCYSSVIRGLRTVLQYQDPGDGPLSYMGGNIGIYSKGYSNFLSDLKELEKDLAKPHERRRPIEMYLRSLIDALRHLSIELSHADGAKILEGLLPLVEQSNEFQFVKRHWDRE